MENPSTDEEQGKDSLFIVPSARLISGLPSLHDLLQATAESIKAPRPDLVSPAARTYLDRLTSLPLHSLVQEPALISAESSTVESELINLCYREYPTFLSVHKCSAAVSNAFDDFRHSLDGLLDSVPSLEEECLAFSHRTVALSSLRHRSVLVQEHQDKLLDLLELPRLMETCVRNGYYHEAMELRAHAKDLYSRYPDVRLVADVNVEVDGVQQLMLAQMFSLLREPIKLQMSIKTVGLLRRLKVLDEPSLLLAFLNGRLHNFQNQLVQIERDRVEPVRYLRRYIDLFRENVYEIVTQCCALFEDIDILVSFANQCVNDLAQLVASYIPRIANDSASMSSILIQLGYCSLSFARIGLDFGALVPAPFAETALATYSSAVSLAADRVSTALASASVSKGLPMEALVPTDNRGVLLSSQPFSANQDDFLAHLPAIPALAHCANDHLATLNALRLLAPVACMPTLADILCQSLLALTKSIHAFVQEAVSIASPTQDKVYSHSRMPSSPRSRLIRRNTETQLSPAALNAKRRDNQKLCAVLARAWHALARYLVRSLLVGVYDRRDYPMSSELDSTLEGLRAWADSSEDKPHGGQNGGPASDRVGTPPIRGLVEDPIAERELDTAIPVTPDLSDKQDIATPPNPLSPPQVTTGEPATPPNPSSSRDIETLPVIDALTTPIVDNSKSSPDSKLEEADVGQSPTPLVKPPAGPSHDDIRPAQTSPSNVVEAMFAPAPDGGTVPDEELAAVLENPASVLPEEAIPPTSLKLEDAPLPPEGEVDMGPNKGAMSSLQGVATDTDTEATASSSARKHDDPDLPSAPSIPNNVALKEGVDTENPVETPSQTPTAPTSVDGEDNDEEQTESRPTDRLEETSGNSGAGGTTGTKGGQKKKKKKKK